MRQFWTVFKFEFKTYAKNKAFIIITLLLVIGAGVVLSIPRIQSAITPKNQPSAPTQKTVVALADISGEDVNAAAAYYTAHIPNTQFKVTNQSTEEIKKQVDSGSLESAIIIQSSLSYTHIVKNVGMFNTFDSQFDEVMLAKYRSEKLAQFGVSKADTEHFLSDSVQAKTVQTSSGKNQIQNFFYTYILIFALYMAILLYGQFVATSVASEKSSRAMELLITSTKPKNLMFGKVMGAGLAGLSQFVLIFGSSYLFYNLNQSYFKGNLIVQSIFNMPLPILLYTILFFLLGFFLYAFMYGALGSLVSRIEELNSTIMPVTMVFIIAFFIVMFSMASGNVDTTLMKVCSFIPFTSPMAMFVRIAMGEVANWEIAVSVAILVASTVAIGYFAAMIYRMGVLLYGKAPKPMEIIKLLKNK